MGGPVKRITDLISILAQISPQAINTKQTIFQMQIYVKESSRTQQEVTGSQFVIMFNIIDPTYKHGSIRTSLYRVEVRFTFEPIYFPLHVIKLTFVGVG